LGEKLLIDVRMREEFLMEHIKGSVNIPHYDLAAWEGFLRGKDITIYCNTGHRSEIAGKKLADLGIDCTVLGLDEQETEDWEGKPMFCAVNYVEIRAGQEDAFRERAFQLCKLTELYDGFLGSKVLKVSGVSAVGSGIPGDLRNQVFEPLRYILITYWESKEAHEESHAHPAFAEIYDELPKTLAKAPYEEFCDVLK
jgi:rhodanese-related sulfurtransferase